MYGRGRREFVPTLLQKEARILSGISRAMNVETVAGWGASLWVRRVPCSPLCEVFKSGARSLFSSGCLGGGPDTVETRLGAGVVQMSPGRAADTDPPDDLAPHLDRQAAAENQDPLIHIP